MCIITAFSCRWLELAVFHDVVVKLLVFCCDVWKNSLNFTDSRDDIINCLILWDSNIPLWFQQSMKLTETSWAYCCHESCFNVWVRQTLLEKFLGFWLFYLQLWIDSFRRAVFQSFGDGAKNYFCKLNVIYDHIYVTTAWNIQASSRVFLMASGEDHTSVPSLLYSWNVFKDMYLIFSNIELLCFQGYE